VLTDREDGKDVSFNIDLVLDKRFTERDLIGIGSQQGERLRSFQDNCTGWTLGNR
jgi:hypothetical protein